MTVMITVSEVVYIIVVCLLANMFLLNVSIVEYYDRCIMM